MIAGMDEMKHKIMLNYYKIKIIFLFIPGIMRGFPVLLLQWRSVESSTEGDRPLRRHPKSWSTESSAHLAISAAANDDRTLIYAHHRNNVTYLLYRQIYNFSNCYKHTYYTSNDINNIS